MTAAVSPPVARSPAAAGTRVTVAAKLMPATERDRTGDFCVVSERPDGSTGLVIGEVDRLCATSAGHADRARSLASAAASDAPSAAELLKRLDVSLRDSGLAASAAAVVVPRAGEQATWACAGMPIPRRLDSGDPLADDDVVGQRLGASAGPCQREEGCVDIDQRGGLALVTDGVLRAQGPGGQQFAAQRLTHALRCLAGRSPACTAAELLRAVCHFSAHHLKDDAGALVFRLA